MRAEIVILAVVAVGLLAWKSQPQPSAPSPSSGAPTGGSGASMGGVNWRDPAGTVARAGKATVAGVVAGVQNIPANIGAEIQGARMGGQFGANVGGVFGAGTAGGFLGASAGAIVGGVADSAKVGTQAALHSFFGA